MTKYLIVYFVITKIVMLAVKIAVLNSIGNIMKEKKYGITNKSKRYTIADYPDGSGEEPKFYIKINEDCYT